MKKIVLISVVVILLLGLVGIVYFVTDTTDESVASSIDDDPFDLPTALINAVSGDVIEMQEDALIYSNLSVNPGVILNDMGFSLIIQLSSTFVVSGELISSGELSIRGTVVVVDGGCLTIENNGNSAGRDKKTATVTGTLNVFEGGTLNVGLLNKSYLSFIDNGKLWIGGDMNVGNASISNYSVVDVINGSITGNLQISSGSTFRVSDVLTVGTPPSLTTDMSSNTVVSGLVTLGSTACIIVYGEASFFNGKNIKYAVYTNFLFDNKYAYATEYKSTTGNRTLILPSTNGLIDCELENWKDSNGNVISSDSNIQIGTIGYTTIYGEVSNKIYNITLSKDNSIKWIQVGNNGVTTELSGVVPALYNSSYTISIRATGNAPLPTIYMNGAPCDGTSVSFKVTGNVTLATSNNYRTEDGGGSSSLLIVLMIIIIILVIALAVLILKYRKKTGT